MLVAAALLVSLAPGRSGDLPPLPRSTPLSRAGPAPAAVGNRAPAARGKMAVLTTNQELQRKLDELKSLAEGNMIDKFIQAFVPLDLEEADLLDFTRRQRDFPEEWENLKDEICAIATGAGVTRIEGDQVTTAVFYFKHPKVEQMDREVVFVFSPPNPPEFPNGEWRAEG